MRAILSEIPLGKWRTKIGLVLRQAWFINGCFFNRILYLHNILRRQDSELVKNIYIAMKESPLKDDWIHLVNKDKLDIDLNLSVKAISKLSKYQFKRIVKLKIRKFILNQLINIKEGHSKIKHIRYQDLKSP